MPRAKNETVYQEILSNAHGLFLNKGYKNTSYQDIADASGQKRNLVQYYFPHKTQLAVLLFEKLLEGVTEFITNKNFACHNPYATMLRIGYLHFHFLLKDAEKRQFTEDVLQSRDLTDTMLLFDFDWGMKFLGIEASESQEMLKEEILYAMGGFYELLYVSLRSEKEMNVEKYLRRVVLAIGEAAGMTRDEVLSLTEEAGLPEEVLKACDETVERKILAKV